MIIDKKWTSGKVHSGIDCSNYMPEVIDNLRT